MNAIKMPKVSYAKCDECGAIAEYYFNEYGATECCDRCNAAPINLTRVLVSNA
jgi:uncharacterized paraquat-inducible protein A